jgi:2',3'-cyclic-nucleotide 2'-phosphodiesterase (5'-nucleotidase family)
MVARLLHYSDLENAYDDPVRVGRLASLLADRRGPDTAVVGTGDNTAPGVLSMVTGGRQALDFFTAVAPDIDTFGNHDFDYGLTTTREIVRESPQTWVSANVRHEGAVFGRDAGVVSATVLERDGVRIGFTGVTEPRTASMCPGATELTFTDPIAAAKRECDRLREDDIDAVVVCSHLGIDDDELARETEADAVLGGHVHDERTAEIDGTICTRPGANGHCVYEIDLARGETTRHAVADWPVDESVAAALRERRATTGLESVVGHVADPIERGLDLTRGGECRIGNFVADAYRWAADADVGLQNSGGIREGAPLAGEVTVADLVSVIPFDEPVVRTEVSGAELVAICREADGERLDTLSGGWHAHVSGLTIDRANGADIAVRHRGEPVEPDRTYSLATTNYVLHTDHEFPTLAEGHRVETLRTQYEVLAAYASERGIDPAVEGRIRPVEADD